MRPRSARNRGWNWGVPMSGSTNEPEAVTLHNFVRAETARYFREQLNQAAVNEYFRNRVPVNVDNQVIIRSSFDRN
jgi:hypothetical protein